MPSKDQELTPWFDAYTPPVRDGQYEVQTKEGQFVALFKAGAWYRMHPHDENEGRGEAIQGVRAWRGLAAAPSEAALPEDAKPGVGQNQMGARPGR